ncbi:MAG: PilT/PilU family type 4a pilus ATPase [Planctomycetes bacterium]|nr:PilT/PilU family type 4a pilus ATPase [Planctomycetota bacterium]
MPSAIEFFAELVENSVNLRASDIHITGGMSPYYRVDAEIDPCLDYVLMPELVDQMASSLMSAAQQVVFREKQTLDLAFTGPSGTRFRVNLFRERGQTAMAVRRLDDKFRSIEELHLPESFGEIAEFPHGLVIVTGPTGSGKSTSLASLINRINGSRKGHIVTIEDPVEFVHQNRRCLVHQRELHTDVPSFASAVRAALREDPDVLLVGEMRDIETMRAAITAAETGHLVFSTLHTGDAVGAIDRMISVFPAEEQTCVREQLSRVLRAVVSQRLVTRCDGPGRVPALEIMRVNNAIANQIRLGEPHQIYSVMQTATHDGMLILEQSLADLVAQGLISGTDAKSLARDSNILDSRLRMARGRTPARA